jgi:phosphoribosylamine--glycine ligase
MNVLILGSGGREHALAWKIKQSEKINNLYIAPGNAGTSEVGINIEIQVNDFQNIKDFIINNHIDILVVGPEEPLVKGIYDFLKANESLKNLIIIGPSKQGAMLEGSKKFAKEFMMRHNIPTAKYKAFNNTEYYEAIAFLKTIKPPFVLKADGLAAGKGVLIINSFEEAANELKQMFDGKFGDSGKIVVIEEFLKGTELSVFVITDGKNYLLLPEAKDYKRIGEGDTGLNTGGMGAVSPVPFADKLFIEKVENRIIKPTINGLAKENIIYKGFIFFGLINVDGNPYVIEYNARLGDPESEVVLPRVKSDLIDIFEKVYAEKISEINIEIDKYAASTVMMVSGGYPGNYKKGIPIKMGNIKKSDSIIFHAGTKFNESNEIVTNGGRVIAVTSYGNTIFEALEKSYNSIKEINFDGQYFRKDIGFDLKNF